VPDSIEEYANRGEPAVVPAVVALQDSWNTLPPALAGLIAHLFDLTLQEDMASTTRRLVQRGHDVINGSRGEEQSSNCCGPSGCARYPSSSAGLITRWSSAT